MNDVEPSRGRSATRTGRLLAVIVVTALLAVFAVLNTGSVEVNWVFGTFETPLILLIIVMLGVGIALGYFGARLEARRRRPRG